MLIVFRVSHVSSYVNENVENGYINLESLKLKVQSLIFDIFPKKQKETKKFSF